MTKDTSGSRYYIFPNGFKVAWGSVDYDTGSGTTANWEVTSPIKFADGRIFITPVSGNNQINIQVRPNDSFVTSGTCFAGTVITNKTNYQNTFNWLVVGY